MLPLTFILICSQFWPLTQGQNNELEESTQKQSSVMLIEPLGSFNLTCYIDKNASLCEDPKFSEGTKNTTWNTRCLPYIRRIGAIQGIWERLVYTDGRISYKEPRYVKKSSNLDLRLTNVKKDGKRQLKMLMNIQNFTCRNVGKFECGHGDRMIKPLKTITSRILIKKYVQVDDLETIPVHGTAGVSVSVRQGFSTIVACVMEVSPHFWGWSLDVLCPDDLQSYKFYEGHRRRVVEGLSRQLGDHSGLNCQVNQEEARLSLIMSQELDGCVFRFSLVEKEQKNSGEFINIPLDHLTEEQKILRSINITLSMDHSALPSEERSGVNGRCSGAIFPGIVLMAVGGGFFVLQTVAALIFYKIAGALNRHKWRCLAQYRFRRKRSNDILSEKEEKRRWRLLMKPFKRKRRRRRRRKKEQDEAEKRAKTNETEEKPQSAEESESSESGSSSDSLSAESEFDESKN